MLSSSKTLKEEGLRVGSAAKVTYVYTPTNLRLAWMFLQQLPVDEESPLEGIVEIQGIKSLHQLRELPRVCDACPLTITSIPAPSSLELFLGQAAWRA